MFTVQEVARESGVTIKTLHHYHKIGLLLPSSISESGYRLYDQQAIERLQSILFYRALDFSLMQIKSLLDSDLSREKLLQSQRELMVQKIKYYQQLLISVDETLVSESNGGLSDMNLFKGFKSEDEWREALSEHTQYLQQHGVSVEEALDVDRLNQAAIEAQTFQTDMIDFLVEKVAPNDGRVQARVKEHLEAIHQSSQEFLVATQWFINDDVHRNMLENQQVGLAYYLKSAAEVSQ